ncbi:MAG TPA: hypothetical protein VGB70_01315 [Allosphingosinicella sp.]|jgi:YD repeat-containing protein
MASLLTQPAAAQFPRDLADVMKNPDRQDGNDVDLVSGSVNFGIQLFDASKRGSRLSLRFDDTYPQHPTSQVPTGLNIPAYIGFAGSNEVVHLPDRTVKFGCYTTSSCSGDTLTMVPYGGHSVYHFVGRDGTTMTAEPGLEVTYPDGERINHIYHGVYNGSITGSRLKYVRSNRGFGYQLSYAADSGPQAYKLTKVTFVNESAVYCSWSTPVDCPALAGAPVLLTIGTTGSLTDASGRVVNRQFGGTSVTDLTQVSVAGVPELTRTMNYIHDANADWGEIAYISRVTRGSRVWEYTFSPPLTWFGGWSTASAMSVRGPGGKTILYEGDTESTPRLTRIEDELQRVTQFEYDGEFRVKAIIFPELNRTEAAYDNRGNVISVTRHPKPGSGLAPVVSTASFPASCGAPKTCNKPDYVIDARGNRTDYTYDPQHGGVLTETGPAVNGVRPQTRFSYAQKFAYVRNSSGALVAAPTPVWVLTQISTCKTQPSCQGTPDEVRTQFEYGAPGTADTLLVRGTVVDAGGLSLRTCYTYDLYGNKVSETSPRAGLASCQ